MRTEEAEAFERRAYREAAGRNSAGARVGAEVGAAATGQTKSEDGLLMERVVERSNMWLAYQRVVENKGAPGVDGLTVEQLKGWLKAHWPRVRQALLEGEYIAQPVRRVDIPKPQGGVRMLGVPTVSVNCTFGQHPFGLGRDLPSLSPTERSALPRTEGATGRWRRHGYSAQYRARQLRCSQAMD